MHTERNFTVSGDWDLPLAGSGQKNKISSESKCKVPVQGSNLGRSWTHLLLWTYWMYRYIWNNFLRTKPRNWLRDPFTLGKQEGNQSKQVGNAETQSHYKPHPQTKWEATENPELQPEEQRVQTPHRAPPLFRQVPERQPPRHLLWRPGGQGCGKLRKSS